MAVREHRDASAEERDVTLCNGGLILPAFGDAAADRFAREALEALYPTRRVVQMRIDAIAAGGGGIHCTTQQQPAAQTS